MKLLLVDDHPVVRDGLPLLLKRINAEVRIDKAGSLAEAVEACAAGSYEVVLLDLSLPDSRGLDTLSHFLEADTGTAVVVLSGEEDATIIRAAIEAGAAGFLPKSYASEAMISALKLVLAGGTFIPAAALQAPRSNDDSATKLHERLSGLSERQREVARRMIKGLPYKRIARDLHISEGTVKAHVSAILKVTGAANRVELVLQAARHGRIEP